MMKQASLLLFSSAVAVALSGGVGSVAADDEKVVRLCWFPRFSPDGNLVLTANGHWDGKEGGEARLFAAKDGVVQHVFKHTRGVRSVAWSPKGTMFVTGSFGNGIHGFDVKTQKELFHLDKGRSAENVRISSDDKVLVASYAAGDIRLFDLATRKQLHLFFAAHESGIWGITLSSNDARLASSGKDTYANVYDMATKKRVHSFKHPSEVNGIVFTSDNRYLLTGCGDSQIRVFDLTSGEQAATYKGHFRGTVTDMQFTSDGKMLASTGADGTVRLWDATDLKNGKLVKTIRAHEAMAFGVAISPDDSRVVSAGWDDQVRMWDMKTGEAVWTWKRE